MASNIPVIVQGNSFNLAIPLQIYVINGDQMELQDYTPDPTDQISIQLKGSRRNYTYTPTSVTDNVCMIALGGYELADNYSVAVSIGKANGQRLRSFRTDQFFIVESSDDLTQDDIIQGLEENVIYLNSSIFVAGADGRGIVSITKVSTQGRVDTYAITYTDGTTSTFQVTNGAKGDTGATISSVEKTATAGKVDTYTITMTDGNTFDFEVTNGLDGVDLGLANIVNDLTTGGATNVLSAEQGKVLNEKTERQESVDLSDYELIGSWLTANNVWKNFASNKGKFIPIPSNATSITIVGHNNSSTSFTSVYALLTTDEHVAGSAVSYATGCARAVLAYNTLVKITNIPSDARFLWVGSLADYVDVEPQSVTFGADIWSAIDGLDADVQSLQNEMEDLQGNTMFIGNVVQQGYNASGLTGLNTKRATTETSMVVPKEAATIKFKFPDWLQCAIREGKSSDNLNTHNYYFRNGDTHTFLATSCWFRMCFTMLDDTQDIPVADVLAAIASGELKIYVEGEYSNIIERNAESEVYIKAVMRPFVSGQTKNSGFRNYPVFAHTSDVHGDATRFNSMVDYCDYIGVDACLVSGDMVGKGPSDSAQYINDVADSHNTMVLQCMGNHDARALTTAQAQYDTIMKHLVEKNEVTTNPSETYPTYYYKDFASKKIRVIALNIYEGAHTNDNSNFTQSQCEWFISALASTPQGYGVIVMFHSPLELPTKDNDHATFYQDIVNIAPLPTNITGNPFSQIVDAFIGKTTATISYSIGSTSISVSADFTGVASGVEFIAYVNGHFHIDHIGYAPNTTHKQLCINVICGIGLYGGSTNAYYADISDIPRGLSGTTQDAFNLYVVDRAAKSVRVARVGSNIAGNLTERKFMVIPYAD